MWCGIGRVVMLCACLASGTARAQSADALLRAYPDALDRIEGGTLVWRDGTRMPLDDGRPDKTPAELLRVASIVDMLRLPYPRGAIAAPPTADPGRYRNHPFFAKMYGDCSRGEVERHLVSITWLPLAWGHRIRVTEVNGVARRLEAVSNTIDLLPAPIRQAAYPIAGTYVCRAVADTGAPSMHGTGAAIDMNLRYSDYWVWRRGAPYVNRMPAEIVAAFEANGFIWGGKWSHYDTMHFEYRPELLGMDGE